MGDHYSEMEMALFGKRYEPVKRNKDGWRYHGHRFEIKGGITHFDVLKRQLIEQALKPLFNL